MVLSVPNETSEQDVLIKIHPGFIIGAGKLINSVLFVLIDWTNCFMLFL